ncbi:MAG: hypothetical protein H0U46_07385 [Actinobacteria bacterium]|nr:hypothetical protein [Actinomycetota bacterium]
MDEATGRGHVMRRVALVLGTVVAIGVTPSLALAGNGTQAVESQLVKSQLVKSQLVETQLVRSQLVRSQLVRSALVRSAALTSRKASVAYRAKIRLSH